MVNADPRKNGPSGKYARYISVGFTFIGTLGVLAVLGFLVDRTAETLPLCLIIGLVAGFVAGLYYVYHSLGKLGGG